MSRLLSGTVGTKWRHHGLIFPNRSQNGGSLSVRWRTVDRPKIYQKGTCGKTVQTLSCFAAPLLDLPPHDAVAFARRFFQSFAVNNSNVAAGVGDESRLLQHPSRYGHAGATGSEHLREKFLGQRH